MNVLTDDEVLAIAKREGQKLALGKNPNIDIDFARSIEAAVLEKLKQQEPIGEMSAGTFVHWTNDCVPRCGTKLYAAPVPADDVVKQRDELLAALEGAANYIDNLGGTSQGYRQAIAARGAA